MGELLKNEQGSFNGCFGCGTDNDVGLRLDFEREGDAVVSRLTIDSRYAGYEKFAHGGIVATLLDEAMGWAMINIGGSYGVTSNLNVRYRRPVFVDRPVVLRAALVHREGTMMTLESSIEDARGRLLASAVGEWVVVRRGRALASAESKDAS